MKKMMLLLCVSGVFILILNCGGYENDEDSENKDPKKGVVCTGQTKCYDDIHEIDCPGIDEDYYGQDVQYVDKCLQISYKVNGKKPEEIVIDNNTKLEWQRTVSSEVFNWNEAKIYCDDLDYDGYTDWRLPSESELLTLVHFEKTDPAIDTKYFPDTPSENFHSSNINVSNTALSWGVNFKHGESEYHIDINEKSSYVRCVRGPLLPVHIFKESVIEGQAVVEDLTTGRMWIKQHDGRNYYWADALKYCEDMEYAGYTDWRLPTVNEMESLIVRTKYNPASDFEMYDCFTFWSSTSAFLGEEANAWSGEAWLMDFYGGSVGFLSKTAGAAIRCVR